MKKVLKESLDAIQISDEKLRKLIMETFDNKFSFMSKRNYLRWINTRNISERIKKLAVEMMSEEEIKAHPSWGGYYVHGKDLIVLNRTDIHTADHESNHFLNDGVIQFPVFINEGITEFLSTINVKDLGYSAYPYNVNFVKLLYSIFGDELIKNYFVSVSSEFNNKLSLYLEDDYKVFYSLLEKMHTNMYGKDKNNESSKKELDKLKIKLGEYLIKIVKNSIKDEMLNMKYYTNNTLDYLLLYKTVYERVSYIVELVNMTSKDRIDLCKQIFIEGIKSSYLCKYGEFDLEKFINASFIDNSILYHEMSEYEKKLGKKDNMYVAINMKLDSCDYYSNGKFDISMFMLDFYSLINVGYPNIDKSSKVKLLYELLFKKLKSNINMGFVNSLIDKYDELYNGLANVRTSNRKTISDSKYFDISKYLGIKAYIEKRDNEFYLIKYNLKENKFERKGMGFYQVVSGSREFPFVIEYIDRSSKYSESYKIYFDKYFDRFMYAGNIMDCKDSINDVLDNLLVEEISNSIDYNRYKVLYEKNSLIERIDGIKIVGDYINEDVYIIDFQLLFDDLKNNVVSLKDEVINSTIKSIIKNILKKTYGKLEIPENLIDSICVIANKYILQNDISSIKELEMISLDLIKKYKEYVNSSEKKYAIVADEPAFGKFKKVTETRSKNEETKRINNEAKEYVITNFKNFIKKENSNYFSVDEFKYNINSIKFNAYTFNTPVAEEIDFELLINCLKEIVNNVPVKDKYVYFRKYYLYLSILLFGEIDIKKNSIQEKIHEIQNLIGDIIENMVLNDGPIDVENLNSLFSALVEEFNSKKEKVMAEFKPSLLEIPNEIRPIYDRIWAIVHDESKSIELKKELIDSLSKSANDIIEGMPNNKELKRLKEKIEEHRKSLFSVNETKNR